MKKNSKNTTKKSSKNSKKHNILLNVINKNREKDDLLSKDAFFNKNDLDTKKTKKNIYLNNKKNKKNKENNIIPLTKGTNIVSKKTIIFLGVLFSLIILFLIIRLFFIQILEGDALRQRAYNQQSINQIISAKRGNIYDATGKALAISASVDTVTINPILISDSDQAKDIALKEKVAHALSDIFTLDYTEVFNKVNSGNQFETIIKKVEKDKIDLLTTWMEENNIYSGININDDNKRYYPYDTICSAVIGFCNNDNQGAYGIEDTYNEILSGTSGKIVSSQDKDQRELPNAEESYIPAENGSNLTLTIDLQIQSIVEKYLKQAVENNKCELGGNVIAMNPQNGDILAMANYPDYNLNNPYTPLPNTSYSYGYENLSTEEKSNTLYEMWANKSISGGYEPGSIFKIITAAVGLEENITETDIANDFVCNGHEYFKDGTSEIGIACWRYYRPHGHQTLRQALCNSCNPAFMQLADRIGASILFKYYKSFGFMDKTNSGLYGEQPSIFHPLDKMGEVELATYSFGQRFQVTPLQMIAAVSAVANKGVLMQPRIVKEFTNTDTGATTTIEPVEIRQVISKKTAEEVTSMMESVVTVGTGINGSVKGYSIGGKTGTSEPKQNDEESGYVASYVAISPTTNSQIALLLTLYKPSNGEIQGGQIAAPVISQMLSEILPYLEVPTDSETSTINQNNLISIPDVRNKTVTEANKILKAAGFKVKTISTKDPNTTLVLDQNPKPGVNLIKDSITLIYGEKDTVATSVKVPDLNDMNISEATNTLKKLNLNISVKGIGISTNQDYLTNELVPEGTVITVTFKETITEAH